jgi:hypothetical protein
MPDDDDGVTAMLINPVYAISISPDLEGKREPLVSRDLWIEANRRLIDEIGAEEWLRRLLTTLEGGAQTPAHDAEGS